MGNWVKINGKLYYRIELSSSHALIFTPTEYEAALKRGIKASRFGAKITKTFGPKKFDRF